MLGKCSITEYIPSHIVIFRLVFCSLPELEPYHVAQEFFNA